jgi:hypothetical protein
VRKIFLKYYCLLALDRRVQLIDRRGTKPKVEFEPLCRKRRHLGVERKKNTSFKKNTSLIDLFEERRPGIFDLSYRTSHLDSQDEQGKGA